MSAWARTYYRTYNRALLRYASSGFTARELDADDHAFLERVRERGHVDVGSLAWPAPTACTYSDDVIHRTALAEEQDFWAHPWEVEAGVERRQGNPAAARAEREARRGQYLEALARKRRARATETAEMRAELAREQEAWQAERRRQEAAAARRRLRQIQADLEWEKAHRDGPAPHARFYTPQWKLEELEAQRAREVELRHAALRRARVRDARLTRKRWKHEQAMAAATWVERNRQTAEKVKAELQRQDLRAAWAEGNRQAAAEQHDRAMRAACEHNDQLALARARQAAALGDWRAQFALKVLELKSQIVRHVVGTHQPWTLTMLAEATHCEDKAFIERCCDELLREGRLTEGPPR